MDWRTSDDSPQNNRRPGALGSEIDCHESLAGAAIPDFECAAFDAEGNGRLRLAAALCRDLRLARRAGARFGADDFAGVNQ